MDNSQDATGAEDIGWKQLFRNIGTDQKTIYWDFPRSLTQGQGWTPTGAFLATTGTLIAVDQYDAPFFRKTANFHGFNSGLSGTNTSLVTAAVPATLYLTGLIRKNRYAQSTGLWTAEAVVDSEIAAEFLKVATRRARP